MFMERTKEKLNKSMVGWFSCFNQSYRGHIISLKKNIGGKSRKKHLLLLIYDLYNTLLDINIQINK